MIKQKIIEGNKLIAEFMGYKLITPSMRKNPEMWNISYWENPEMKKISGKVLCSENNLRYHSSWDWLMPCIDKIEKSYETKDTLPRFEINSHYCSFSIKYKQGYKNWIVGCYLESPEKIKTNSKIEAAYMVIIEFIKYYNLCQKK